MATFQFPKDFLWGTATAAHQVEGNNINTESWVLEHLPETIYAEPSGDACDHYHCYPEDIALLAELGFNAYRFSLDWARIEPEEGEFSNAALEHYRRMLATCHENGIQPVVTFHHFTTPRWLMPYGGWIDEKTPDRFARYCEKAVNHIGDLIGVACTVNEPNIPVLLSKLLPFNIQQTPFWKNAAQTFGVMPERLGLWQFTASPEARNVILSAHKKALEVIKAGPGNFPVGLTMAMVDVQAAEGGKEKAAEFQFEMNDVFLEQLEGDDFIGVQTYSRMVVGPEGVVHPGDDVEKNQMGEEYYPEALGGTIRHAAKVTGLPIIVTENGLSSEDDTRRVEYFQRALHCVVDALGEGIDVRGYFAWSMLDNFEWVSGYGPKFGIIAVDRETQNRTPKPSAYWLGKVALENRLNLD